MRRDRTTHSISIYPVICQPWSLILCIQANFLHLKPQLKLKELVPSQNFRGFIWVYQNKFSWKVSESRNFTTTTSPHDTISHTPPPQQEFHHRHITTSHHTNMHHCSVTCRGKHDNFDEVGMILEWCRGSEILGDSRSAKRFWKRNMANSFFDLFHGSVRIFTA